jgi:hypothetical protein
MHELIRKNRRNAERIAPYIGGEEVNESPNHSHHRYVINFGQLTEEQARQWPELIAIVEAKVRPQRMRQNRQIRSDYWWRFGEVAPALYDAVRDLDQVLVRAQTSKHAAFALLPTGLVYDQTLIVFSLDGYSPFAWLTSNVHEIWARFLGATLEDRLRYTPSDCFETFPFPEAWQSNERTESTGREYYEFRGALMVSNSEGLTTTYNRFHDPDERDPDIIKLRELHDAIDRAVLDAYGWTDIRPICEFILDYEDDEDEENGAGRPRRRKPWRYRWPDDIRDEVLGRLLALNAERAAQEQVAGTEATKSRPTRRQKNATSQTASLLD